DLFRFAAGSGVLCLLPSLRRFRRGLALDLAGVAALGVLGTAWLAHLYLGMPASDLLAASLRRHDRPKLEQKLEHVANLTPHNLLIVGRAVTLYAFVMPVEVGGAAR